jgi:plasmid stabilization system protein ParE
VARLHVLLLLPQAAEDLDAIYEPLLSRVVHRLQLLRRFPQLGRPLTGKFSNWRGTPVGLFRIIYRITARGVEVGYIRHYKKDEPKH